MPGIAAFEKISTFLQELDDEARGVKSAANDDPGGAEGPSSHPSAGVDGGEHEQPHGEQYQDNTSYIKNEEPGGGVDSHRDATPSNAPTAEDAQIGDAKSTGKDPSNEKPDADRAKDPPAGSNDMGGTSHPANASIGEKYSYWTDARIKQASDKQLYALSAELGDEILADVSNGVFNDRRTNPAQPKQIQQHSKAAQAGYEAAQQAGVVDDPDAIAADLVASIVKQAHADADLFADYAKRELARLEKSAMGGMDPAAAAADGAGEAAEGEDHGSSEEGAGGEAEAALLAQLAGGMGGGMEGGAPSMEGGMPPSGGMPAEGGNPLEGLSEEEILQELAAALMEQGGSPEELAATGAEGAKIASHVADFKRQGKFRIEAAKSANHRKARDFCKNYITELVGRSR